MTSNTNHSNNSITSPPIQYLINWSVGIVFGLFLAIWLLLELQVLPEVFITLTPIWIPSYLAFAVASGVRNAVLPALGSGIAFGSLIIVLTYLESVLVGNILRIGHKQLTA